MLNAPFLTISQFDLGALGTGAGTLAALLAVFPFTRAGTGSTGTTGLWWGVLTNTGGDLTSFTELVLFLWFSGITIPFWITEQVVGFYEVVDGEVILPLVQSCAPTNDLLELDHGVHWTHQDDVPNVASIYARAQLLAGGQNRGDGLFVILEVLKVLLAQSTIISRHSLTIIGVGYLFRLIDQIPNKKGMFLRGTKDDGLLVLVDHAHEQFDPLLFPLPNLDGTVEVFLKVAFSSQSSRPS